MSGPPIIDPFADAYTLLRKRMQGMGEDDPTWSALMKVLECHIQYEHSGVRVAVSNDDRNIFWGREAGLEDLRDKLKEHWASVHNEAQEDSS
jgi:hypothetical protein